jgi:glutathione S-transferase
MSLKLSFHPLSSFCHKVLIALYENDTPFEPILVDLGNEESRAAFKKVWPIGKFPVLRDDARDRTVPESTTIIEYLGQYYPGETKLIPEDPDLARQTRFRDRFFDLHVHMHMQKVMGDRRRPDGKKDPHGVDDAKARMRTAYDMIEQDMATKDMATKDMTTKTWAMGDAFTLADCAAAPALFYGNMALPFGDTHKNVVAYFARLKARPSFARALKEAEPYFHLVPR